MNERFCDLEDQKKAECKVAEEPTDDAWLYCDACHRAMHQGDCRVDEVVTGIRCAYPDCDLGKDPSRRNLHGWGSYRRAHPLETAKWPEDPTIGTHY